MSNIFHLNILPALKVLNIKKGIAPHIHDTKKRINFKWILFPYLFALEVRCVSYSFVRSSIRPSKSVSKTSGLLS
jgi:hypothetical protein